ncbi:MAG: hypothetical protein KJ901_13585 [Gammaproteobacteria bacterium]|nr:hypothetical protein [Gammaproteobacteria bacterium]MBU1444426.1 hypothetical protein [Gammaproteobacteria bacterium]
MQVPNLIAALALVASAAGASAVLADTPKIPVDSGDQGTVYVTPNVAPNETSAEVHGATMGVQRPDGAGLYSGMDTAGPRPLYSVGAESGGNVSLNFGVESDGKERNTAKAGIKIKY